MVVAIKDWQILSLMICAVAVSPEAAANELSMTGSFFAPVHPIVHMWACPRTDPAEAGAGYPILEKATHAKIYHATPEDGGYSHHAQLTVHNGVFYAMWSNHLHGEDAPGQFVRFAYSHDGSKWSVPRTLFPPYGEIGKFHQLGVHGTAGGWVVLDDRLYGIMGLTDCIGYANSDRGSMQSHRDEHHVFMVREAIGMVARSVDVSDDDLSLGPILTLPGCRALCGTGPLAREMAPAGEAWQSTAARLLAAVERKNPPVEHKAVDSPRPCEPVYYRARDGRHVCLLRDDGGSCRMYASVSADGSAWPTAQPTDIPDSPSRSDVVVMGDGTVLLIGNQMEPWYGKPGGVPRFRDPLMVSVSADGYLFTRAYALRCGMQEFRVPDVGGRGGGGQYPSSLLYNKRLYVLYSMGKEDIWISSVALQDLGIDSSSSALCADLRDDGNTIDDVTKRQYKER